MFNRAKQMEKEGRDIIHLEIGRPDFNTPGHIVAAAVEALHAGKHHYCPNAGIPELRQAVSEEFIEEYGLHYDPASEVLITNGVAEGVFLAINALLDPEDQVLIPDPRWVNYEPDAMINFVEPVSYTLYEDNGYQPDPEEIAEKITPRTRMLILASPSNPTGGVISLEILEKIASLAVQNDLIVVSDEIYDKIIYPPAEHVCPATLEGLKERTIILNGFSKFYSMTGWRLGYALAPKDLLEPMLRYHQYMITSTNTFAQWGAVAALKSDQSPSFAMRDEFLKRRDYIHEAVNNIPGFACSRPDGAFYLFPAVRQTGLSGIEIATRLLEKAGVATVAGEYFGDVGAGHIRISYANSLENLKQAVERIEQVVTDLM
jgi:aspartate/methionine/tyrosine aminotransferase